MEWLIENKDWLFSGAGIVIITSLLTIGKKKFGQKRTHQTINSGDKSVNIQGSSNVKVERWKNKDERKK